RPLDIPRISSVTIGLMARRSSLAIGGLLAVAVLAAGIVLFLRQGTPSEGPRGKGSRDVAQGYGLDLPSTADPSAPRRIEALRAAAAEESSRAQLTVDYPQAQSIVPPELPPPTFLWHDGSAQADAWLAEVTWEGGTERIDVLVKGEPPAQGEIDKRCI